MATGSAPDSSWRRSTDLSTESEERISFTMSYKEKHENTFNAQKKETISLSRVVGTRLTLEYKHS